MIEDHARRAAESTGLREGPSRHCSSRSASTAEAPRSPVKPWRSCCLVLLAIHRQGSFRRQPQAFNGDSERPPSGSAALGSPTTRPRTSRVVQWASSTSRSFWKRPRCSGGNGVTVIPSGSHPAKPILRRPTSRLSTEQGACKAVSADPGLGSGGEPAQDEAG